jgi:hypothetical protein
MSDDYEDEAFKELESRLGRDKLKQVMTNLDSELSIYRNEIIEEIAKEIEGFTPAFGIDTTNSFAIFVRGMKT